MLTVVTDELEPLPSSTARVVFVEALAEIVGEGAKAVATASGADPGTAALAGGSAAGSLKALDVAAARLGQARRERRRVFIDEAERVSGRGFEELLERAMSDEQTLDLFRRAIERAQRQADDDLVKFYARTATSGVLASNRGRVDIEERVFSTIARLDAADVRVLLHVTEPETSDYWLVEAPENTRTHNNVLREEFPELDDVLDSIVPRLEGAGLLTTRVSGGFTSGTSYKVTPFARLCRARVLGKPDPPKPTE